ncbi:MAG: DNA polymerase/3'-5' exonuclease PolX [Phycisphaerales bacterium]|nr:MAG: DNA polymerase/3'-5' exonuclease PolX [Phycisphaerales bacterium]
MSRNAELAGLLQQMADLMELTGADRFRVAAHARASRTVDSITQDIDELADDRDALLAVDGIGAKMADKIQEFSRTGRIGEHEALLQEVPPGLLGVMDVPGLGPKTVRLLWKELGVEGVDDLKRVIDDGSILNLPRMGEKTVANIRDALVFARASAERTPLGVALPAALALVQRLEGVKGVSRVEYAGSVRRGRATIGDVDILACAEDGGAAHEMFRAMPEVEKVLASGETKTSVRLLTSRNKRLQADLRTVGREHYGAALLYFTGSKEHNVRLRERAIRMGMTLNEYGLYKESKGKKTEGSPQSRGEKPVASRTEEDIYAALGLPWIPPELREGAGELDHPADHDFGLIEIADIKAELHAHTDASDGRMSIVELAERAKERGFHTIAVTDHSKSQPIAGGLHPDRLREHIEHIHAARSRVKGITILAGSEVDILADGSLDYDDELLAKLDIVVASPHAALKQDPDAATRRLLRAIAHPLVHILGHPTGRLINRREGMSPDIRALALAAAEHGTALEINANWMRLDLRDAHVRMALDISPDTLIAIDCDVHSESDFDQLGFGVLTARRGGLTPSRCVNTWPAKKLHAWLKSKR